MAEPSSPQRLWAQHLRSKVGGTIAVKTYRDEAEGTSIFLFTSRNESGVLAATIGLMDVELRWQSGVATRTEILMDRRGEEDVVANILSTIAFYVIKNGWKPRPGAVFESMVSMYIPETNLPHVYFAAPFQWDDMSRVHLGDRTIFPLVAVPVSEAEADLAGKNSGKDLEELWVRLGSDVLDWGRASAA